MIIVEVYVPSVGKYYDFRLDNHTLVEDLQEEMIEMVCQREHCSLQESSPLLTLWKVEQHTLLNAGTTLAQNNVSNGDKLMLV